MIDYVPIKYSHETVVKYYQEKQSPVFIGIDSVKLDKNTQTLIDTVKPSGIVLLSKNITSEKQLISLISSIKEYGKNRGIDIKISIDEEIGSISRISKYDNRYIKSNRNISDIQEQAKHLKELGIDINLSPVVDIGYNKNTPISFRTYGNNPKKTSNEISKHIKIQQEQGISNTAKHFPGLGRSIEDTHTHTTNVTITKNEWSNTDAQPFISAISSTVDYIMTGHVKYPLIANQIATYSPTWNEILRKDLKYQGDIIADDLKMEGASIKSNEKCSSSKNIYAQRIYYSNKVNTYSIIILNQPDMINTYKEWIRIEKECLK